MVRIMTAEHAVEMIPDGACIAINAFLALANPNALHAALAKRFRETGHPAELELFCPVGFGGWEEGLFADSYVAMGAVRKVVASHFMSMPAVMRATRENAIECYCMPLGVLSHALRAAAGGRKHLLSKVGLGIFVDPRMDGPGLNERSREEWVRVVEVEGEEYLSYRTPRPTVAFLKGTTVDPSGNISFEKEAVTVDALATAQAVRANGGKVIVQVEQVSHVYARPRQVIVPGVLVDAVVVSDDIPDMQAHHPVLAGDIHVPPLHMDYWMDKLRVQGGRQNGGAAAEIIGRRAAQELCMGDVVNIGIGIPEQVGRFASAMGILKDVTLTVEAGAIGGVPALGKSFGASIGADFICDTSQQFDFYDGGGLDICFMGAAEVDRHGNVNAHRIGEQFAGIGGFANITSAAKTVVFCTTFTGKGLLAAEQDGGVHIEREGTLRKFVPTISAVSFNAHRALERQQRVLYVTERCVFELTAQGLRLLEVFCGIDAERQIEAHLGFDLVK